ncbi:hypothetical protein [Gandjariella thermophila]|uniref:DUF2637 domain-containing protein n=1 Tax=Gandjariella thermophila TaxID=1931992 RepID=A0A4D4J8X5_9PSEU|nr:hypothetical protein [Gandjariella thermophila]GDY33275.1 hypothetical protein GTS_49080 [Gandjariella thermophila]
MTRPDTGGRLRPPARPAGAEPIERVAVQVDRLCWTGILLGLAFTMTNVQQFAAAGSRPWSLPWLAAWLLDPMVSLVLLAVLRAEQVTARYGVRTGGWARGAKWFTLAATYVMNTWSAFVARSPALVVLHSVPPLAVFVAAEAVTDLRDKLGAAIAAAFVNAPDANGEAPETPAEDQPVGPARRTSFADYRARALAAYTPDVTVTPAWVREVTGCSRGMSSRLAKALAAEVQAGEVGRERS